jgi:hypothetical protein
VAVWRFETGEFVNGSKKMICSAGAKRLITLSALLAGSNRHIATMAVAVSRSAFFRSATRTQAVLLARRGFGLISPLRLSTTRTGYTDCGEHSGESQLVSVWVSSGDSNGLKVLKCLGQWLFKYMERYQSVSAKTVPSRPGTKSSVRNRSRAAVKTQSGANGRNAGAAFRAPRRGCPVHSR